MLPRRSILNHEPPRGVWPGTRFFITINCKERGSNQLCHERVADILLSSARHRESIGQWGLTLLLLMPDHLHMIVGFEEDAPIKKTVSLWKQYTARHAGVRWQRDFFDHRLRHDQSVQETAHYILQNPVKAGLVSHPDEWPFMIKSEDFW